MNKNTKNILIALLTISVIVTGGFLVYSYYGKKPVEKRVVTEVAVDPETQVDEEVQKAGRNYTDSKIEDGKITRTFYMGNVEYLADDGSYQPIDTTIVESEGDYAYENTTNVFKTYFKENAQADDLIKFQISERSVTFSLVGAKESEPVTEGNTITYPDVYEGLTAKYTITSQQLLEELIAEKEVTIDKISQEIKLSGVYYKKQLDGSITFHDENTKKIVFIIPKPVMYEQDEPLNNNFGLHCEITESKDGYIISKVIDQEGKEWLKQANYPIVIDYTLTIYNLDTSWDLEGYIRREGYPPGSDTYDAYPGATIGWTGGESPGSTSYNYRTFFNFNVTSLGGATIESAYFEHYSRRYSGITADINVYAGADAWSGINPNRTTYESDLVMGDGNPGTDDNMATFNTSTLPYNCDNPEDCRQQIDIPQPWFWIFNSGDNTQFLFVCMGPCEGSINYRGARTYMTSYEQSREPRLVLELTVVPPDLDIFPAFAQGILEPRLFDYSDNETNWVMQRSLDGVNFSTICDNMVSGSSGTCSPLATASYNCNATSTSGNIGNECSFTDTNLNPNTQYYYRAYAERDSPYARSSYSNIVSQYTLPTPVSSGPNLDSPDWRTIRINSAPTDDSGDNPADTIYCMMFDIDPTTIGINSNCSLQRYLGYYGEASVEYVFDLDQDYFGCMHVLWSTIQCHTKAEWQNIVANPNLFPAVSNTLWIEGVPLSPNRLYTGGMYTMYKGDDSLISPDNTTPRYTRARDPSPPVVSLSAPQTLNIIMDNTPTGASAYTNPDDTDYSMRVVYSSLTRYVNPSNQTLTDMVETWWPHDVAGGNPNWGGATGRDYAGGVNVCYEFQARSRNKDGEIGEDETQDSWSSVTSICTEANTPGQPTVECDYELPNGGFEGGDYYYCKVTINPNHNPNGTEYYIEYSNDGSSWSVAQDWRFYPQGQGFPPSFIFSHQPLTCDASHSIYYYRVKARNRATPPQETDWSAVGFDTLPPCQPQNMGHTNNPVEGSDYPIYWAWGAPAGGETVSYYNFYDSHGACLAGNDKDGFCALTGPKDSELNSPDYIQYKDSSNQPLRVNTQHSAYVQPVDGRGRAGRASSTASFYNSIEWPSGVTLQPVDVEPDQIIVTANGSFSNLTLGNSGIQFQQTFTGNCSITTDQSCFDNTNCPDGETCVNPGRAPNGGGDTGFTGFVQSTQATDNDLSPNRKYCYQARSCNGDCSATDGTNDISDWQPGTAQCTYTLANIPSAPRLVKQESSTDINLMIRTADDNPHISTDSEELGADTQYALCVTKYDLNDQEEFSVYANPTTGYLGSCNNEPDISNETDCTSADETWIWNDSCDYQNTSDQYWTIRGTGAGDGWGGDDGVNLTGLSTSKYDFSFQARNGDNVPTVFGPKATLFLVKNNVVGWAWSSNIGWISLNCLNLYSSPAAYGYSCESPSQIRRGDGCG